MCLRRWTQGGHGRVRIAHNLCLACSIKKYAKAGSSAGKHDKPIKQRKNRKNASNCKKRKNAVVDSEEDDCEEGDQALELADEDESEMTDVTSDDDENQDQEEEFDCNCEDTEAAEAEGRPSWAMLNKLMLHELQAVAGAFLSTEQFENIPKRKHELASYLVTANSMTCTLETFDAFLSNYRSAYKPQKRKKQQLEVVVQAAAEQERQQLASSSTETNQLQNELYAAALADFRQKNGKYPTPAQVGRLWDTAMLRAHDKLHSHSNDRGPDHEGAVACEQRRSRRRKRIRVEGVGFLDFH